MSDIDCPRARTDMTPCVARDGATATSDDRGAYPTCVGCDADPRELLHDLGERYAPARGYRQTVDRDACADRLREMVAAYVESKP